MQKGIFFRHVQVSFFLTYERKIPCIKVLTNYGRRKLLFHLKFSNFFFERVIISFRKVLPRSFTYCLPKTSEKTFQKKKTTALLNPEKKLANLIAHRIIFLWNALINRKKLGQISFEWLIIMPEAEFSNFFCLKCSGLKVTFNRNVMLT